MLDSIDKKELAVYKNGSLLLVGGCKMNDFLGRAPRDASGDRIGDDEHQKRINLLRVLVNKARLGMVILDQDYKVLDANQSFADMLGYSLEEVKQLHVWDWEDSQSQAEIRENFSDLSTVDFSLETRHRRKDGSILDVELNGTGTKIRGKNGKQNVIMTISQDITARKKLERQLQHSENKFRRFVENAADIILTVNAELEITYISPNCKKNYRIRSRRAGREKNAIVLFVR